ncbi:MAG TPA: 2-C-methyl-D-erythritol 4-phosphate cytidylyltransferase, partial [Pyrinomonadaceae bacterium]
LLMNVAIIAAAGQGTRMAGKRPKQFLELAGIPIVFHTLKAFEQCDLIEEIIVVVAADQADDFLSLADKDDLRKLRAVVPGGATRAESVRNGLRAVDETNVEIVAVHDGVRPFVTPDEIGRTVQAAKMEGAAILVSAPVDTVKEVKDGVVLKTLQRAELRNALTPQCFTYKLLHDAYEEADVSDPELTDDSSLVERLGVKIVAVEGSSRNIKITRPEDIAVGEAILKTRNFELSS